MKLEVGMYVRSNLNYINKIIAICPDRKKPYVFKIDDEHCEVYGYEEHQIKKASHNIIDLIEVGDYVNGDKVIYTNDGYFEVGEENDNIGFTSDKFIKSIVTKEQFESMSYKVEE